MKTLSDIQHELCQLHGIAQGFTLIQNEKPDHNSLIPLADLIERRLDELTQDVEQMDDSAKLVVLVG